MENYIGCGSIPLPATKYFDNMAYGLKLSLIWTSIEKISILGIQFVGILFLSRLLSPKEFGLIGILTIFLALSNMLIDAGMGGALVREKNISKKDLSTLFVYNGFVSVSIYMLLFLFAPFLARIYHNDLLCPLLRVLGLSVIVSAFSITQIVLLLRRLKFRTMAILGILSSLISIIVAIISAFKGLGVWSLVLQTLTQSLLYSLMSFIVVKFIPSIQFNRNSFKHQFSYGVGLLGANCVNTFAANINNSIIGKLFSLYQTGFYTQSTRLYNLPNGFLTSVTEKALFPILSKTNSQNEVIKFTLRFVSLSNVIVLPLWAFLSAASIYIVRIVLGLQWTNASWIFSLLCVGGIFSIMKSLYRNMFKVLGLTMQIMKLEIISLIITFFLIVVLSHISFRVAVIGVSISNILSALLFVLSLKKIYKLSIWEQLKSTISPIICAVFVYVSIVCAVDLFGIDSDWLNLVISLVIAIVATIIYYNIADNNGYNYLIDSITKWLNLRK